MDRLHRTVGHCDGVFRLWGGWPCGEHAGCRLAARTELGSRRHCGAGAAGHGAQPLPGLATRHHCRGGCHPCAGAAWFIQPGRRHSPGRPRRADCLPRPCRRACGYRHHTGVARRAGAACLAAFLVLLGGLLCPRPPRRGSTLQRLLSRGRVGVWRRPCRAAAAARHGRRAPMGFRWPVPRGGMARRMPCPGRSLRSPPTSVRLQAPSVG